jgi:ubiquinol oxidase
MLAPPATDREARSITGPGGRSLLGMTTPTIPTLPTVPPQVRRTVFAPPAVHALQTVPIQQVRLAGGPPTTAACTPKLGRRALRREQQVTLHAPPRRYGLIARLLFVTMDLMYGRRRALEKFQVLEIVARVPYQIWENAAYRALTRWHRDGGLARRIRERILETREQQDNEQWHLLILTELCAARGLGRSRLRFRVLPWLLAVSWYHLSWLMFLVSPVRSYRLNADFEDHAEREYARFVEEHPEFEVQPHDSAFAVEYGALPTTADLLRQIGHDERKHKQESEAYCAAGRLTRR